MTDENRKIAFICSKGTLDMVYPALIMGWAALGNGIDVTIFFTFWGLDMIRKLGTFVEFSVMGAPVSIDWSIIGDHKELNIHGASLSPYTYPTAIDMIANDRLPLGQIITHELPLCDFQRAVDLITSDKRSIKVVLKP